MRDADEDEHILRRFVNEYATVPDNVDVHVLGTDDGVGACPYPRLINLALQHATTDWVISLHNSLQLQPNARLDLLNLLDELDERRSVAFVLPSFAVPFGVKSVHKSPLAKRDLTRAVRLGTLERLDETRCLQCHEPTDTERWFEAKNMYAVK
jgi:hypothetical protein